MVDAKAVIGVAINDVITAGLGVPSLDVTTVASAAGVAFVAGAALGASLDGKRMLPWAKLVV